MNVHVLVLVLLVGAALQTADGLGVRKRLVRRKKMLPGVEGSNQYSENSLAEHRHIKPVRVLRKRIKNQQAVKQVIQKEIASLEAQTYPNMSTTIAPHLKPFSVEEPVAAKPDAVKRFLSLFTIVSFKNDACVSTAGTNGTCYSSNDCTSLGGSAAGTCASGFGVCCLFTATCGGTTNVNGTYFQNSGYPSTFDNVGSCQLTVNKCADSVCQLRLDIESMTLSGPESTDHQCQGDQFIVSGGSPVPAICGTNTGTHMYVDMGLATNSPVVLTVVTSGVSFARSFSVKVTQIECTSLSKASDGCLQYFTGVSGQLFSFNYNNAEGLMLSQSDYTMCIRMERNFCGIQYTACTDSVNTPAMSFSVTGGSPAAGSEVANSCVTDWITIPCATNTNDPTTQSGTPVVCVDRICGMVFNSVVTASGSSSVPVYSYSKPFNIYVHTDSLEGSSAPVESNNRGFCLNFVQQPCTSTTG